MRYTLSSVMNLTELLHICYFFSLTMREVDGSNILAVFPIAMPKHSYVQILKTLAMKGHNVTILNSLNYSQKEVIPNFNEIKIPNTLRGFLVEARNRELGNMTTAWYTIFGFRYFCKIMLDGIVQLPELKTFLNDTGSTYDLLILEPFQCLEPFLALGHKYRVPVVAFLTSQDLGCSVSQIKANPFSATYIPNPKLSYFDRMDFWQRLTNLMVNALEFVVDQFNWIYMDWFMRSHFVYPGFENLPWLTDMMRNISMFLIDSDKWFTYPRPYLPNMIEFGGYFNKSTAELPEDVEKFLNDSTDGFILFSWGPVLRSYFTWKSSSILLPTFAKLKQRVLIKWFEEELTGKPNNVMIRSDIDEASVLGHPNIRLFITHGSVQGITEAIYFGVPVLGIKSIGIAAPLFGSNARNLMIAERQGIGLSIDVNTMTKRTFEAAVNEILNNASYKENAMRKSRILRDRPTDGLEHAVYWIEYVLRHKGAYHLQPATLQLPWYQFWALDLFAFFGVVICAILALASHLLRSLCRQITNSLK